MVFSTDGSKFLKLIFFFTLSVTASAHGDKTTGVTYDARSLIINGKRELLFSGSIHYPRSTPDMWPLLISKAKHGGLNVIQTYVFWNAHEPVQGQYNFEGRFDLVKFLKTAWNQGMYVTLRLGPFIQAEWNYGGFPYWLREVKNITFRTDNKPFKDHMEKFVKMIVDLMKKEKLYATQGGPIILSQIENEYNTIQVAFDNHGTSYVQWAGKMAVKQDTGVPWVMCKQKDAPDPVINACNGRNCGDTFAGPNSPDKPSLWTENWTAQFRVFGDPPSQRSAEDIAYSVARFFSKNGTLVNYYMYHGGTNFGRTSSSFVTTRYYDEAPLDEYGMQKDPKWGHLKELHSALRSCRKPLLWGTPSVEILGKNLEAGIYQVGSDCAAFLTNNDSRSHATVTFKGSEYYLPPHSISILPDCKNVVFNTHRVLSQHNARGYRLADEANKNMEWQMYQENPVSFHECPVRYPGHLEHMSTTKDASDYLWYTTRLTLEKDDLPMRHDIKPVLRAASLGDAMHVFVNGEYVGSAHGEHVEKSFTFMKQVDLQEGSNQIALLSMTVGFPDSGVYLERRLSGVHAAAVLGLNTGTLDLSANDWGHKVGIPGESMEIFTEEGSKKVEWSKASSGKHLSWYKRYFDTPLGDDPIALDLSSMEKGQMWVNGQGIGRYWISFKSPLGEATQHMYHVPRSFLKPSNNLLVVFEEIGGDPEKILFNTVNRDTICSYITEFCDPKNPGKDDTQRQVRLKCPNHKVIKVIEFASYGNPSGACGNYQMGTCNHQNTKNVVEKACLEKTSCTIPLTSETFGEDACPGTSKTLAIQARCVGQKDKNWQQKYEYDG